MNITRLAFWRRREPDSNLYRYAKDELQRAGLFDEDSDYGGMLGDAALEIVAVFAKQGHSGFSANMMSAILGKVLRFEPLTPLTYAPDEWDHISEDIAGGKDTYQNRRKSTVFSDDGLQTWYDLDEPDRPRHLINLDEPA
jgi:hypothetical protein